MATHKSAIKRHRQSLKRRAINRSDRSTLRTQIKKLRTSASAASASDPDGARRMLVETTSLIDRSARKGVIHPNAAARQKSRLARLVNSLSSGGAERSK